MNIETPLEADTELAESGEPGTRALDDPTMSPEPLAAFDATTGYPSLDAALSQIAPATSEVTALISVQFVRPFVRLAIQPWYPQQWHQAWARMPSNRVGWLP